MQAEFPDAAKVAPRRRLSSYNDANASHDVDNGTFALLQQVFQPLCSAALGCTCFGGGAVLQRPVCGSTWATCAGSVLTGHACLPHCARYSIVLIAVVCVRAQA
jgi:hypothetical protein